MQQKSRKSRLVRFATRISQDDKYLIKELALKLTQRYQMNVTQEKVMALILIVFRETHIDYDDYSPVNDFQDLINQVKKHFQNISTKGGLQKVTKQASKRKI